MRLFLSSQDFGDYPQVFKKLMGENKKLAFIINAKDDWSVADRADNVEKHRIELSNLGYDASELDLRQFFGKEQELAKWLKEFGGVFVYGGNTFILRRAMAASGFDEIIKQRLEDGAIVYGGSSAGSCVTAKTLQGIDRGDRPHPDVVPKGYPIKQIIWEGLGLVDFMVVPHYGADWFQKEADLSIKQLQKLGLPYKILRDGQVVVINGDKEEFLK